MIKLWLSFPVVVFIIMGCTFWGEKREKTFAAREVTEENEFIYGSVWVKINPELKSLEISGDVEVKIMDRLSQPTQREFHIFTRPGMNKMVVIEIHTRNHPHTFDEFKELTKKMAVIQKGTKLIDGQSWEVYIRALPEFPEQILSALRQKKIRIREYRCGLEIGAAKQIDRQSRIYISYIKGIEECAKLPQNGGVLNKSQIQTIREFTKQFDANITITHPSG